VKLSEEQSAIAEKLLLEIGERLRFLNEVGLEYLTLDRLSRRFPAARRSAFSWRLRWDQDWWDTLRSR